MSGIGVLLRLGGVITPAEVDTLKAALAHRGPQGVTAVELGECVLVHAQFATTPEAMRESQPMRHHTRDWWLAADARIDNRDDLLRRLRPHVRGPLDTDADLIMAAFERWGNDAPKFLVGDFAFAIWDAEGRKLLLARDQLGFRPVHWTRRSRTFVAASTLRAVQSQFTEPFEVDSSHLAQFVTDRRFSNTDTPWQGISRLEPGSLLRCTPERGPSIERYWYPDPTTRKTSVGEAAEAIRAVFADAVQCRLRATGPIGSELSGGYDSSTVLTQAAATADNVIALSLRFDEPEADEQRYVRAAAQRAATELVVVDSVAVPVGDLAATARITGGLYRAFDSHWYDELSATIARRGGNVCLTGHGGDALLHGGTMAHADLLRHAHAIRAWRQLAGLGTARGKARHYLGGLRTNAVSEVRRSGLWRATGIGQRVEQARAERRAREIPLLLPSLRSSLSARLPQPWFGGPWPFSTEQRLRWYTDPFSAFVAEAWDSEGHLAGVERRHPFYDLRLVEFGLGLSPEVIRPEGEYRGLHRRAFASELPEEVRQRTDKGDFRRPIARVAVRSVGRPGPAPLARLVQDWVDEDAFVKAWRDAQDFCSRGPEPPNLWPWLGSMRLAHWASVHLFD